MAEAGRCPFCGCGDLSMIESVLESGYFVSCNKCEGCGPSSPSPEEALDRWSFRIGEPDIAQVQSYGSIAKDQLN